MLLILVDGVTLLLVARFVQGAALGLVFEASTPALVDLHPTHARDAAALASTVTIVSGQGIGALVGGVFGEWLPDPLHLVWLVYLAALTICFVLLLHVPNDRRPGAGWLVPARLRVRITVETLHTHSDPPARPTAPQRQGPPTFVRAGYDASPPQPPPGVSW